MKKFYLLLPFFLTGCTQLNLGSVGSYKSFLFKKTISEMTINSSVTATGTTNLVIRIKGYSSGAESLIEAAARGAASGMNPGVK